MIDRRAVLKIVALSGPLLMLGIESEATQRGPLFQPSVWYSVDYSGLVTVFIARAEMGQGVYGSLAALVADELDVEWGCVRVLPAPLTDEFGRQSTTASMSVFQAWEPLRRAAAAGREMLISAAAAQWNVRPDRCHTAIGLVVGPTPHRAEYGALTEAASQVPIPSNPIEAF